MTDKNINKTCKIISHGNKVKNNKAIKRNKSIQSQNNFQRVSK